MADPTQKSSLSLAELDAALKGVGIESAEHPGCYYRVVNGIVEWVNPPMLPNEEYRTTERYLGKPVYAFAMDVGSLPNTAAMSVIHNRGSDTLVKEFGGSCSNGNSLPFVYNSKNDNYKITLGVDYAAFYLETFSNRTNLTATVWMKFIKTTD